MSQRLIIRRRRKKNPGTSKGVKRRVVRKPYVKQSRGGAGR